MKETRTGLTFKLGLKLWSTDVVHISQIGSLHEEDVFQYIELTGVPGSFHDTPHAGRIWTSHSSFTRLITAWV